MNEHEEKISSLEFDYGNLKKEVANLRDENSTLTAAVDDLENRSKRNNVVFYGIPETGETEDCRQTVDTVLQQFVGLSSSAYSIERVHRTPTVRQQGSQSQSGHVRNKPRMIHACFSSFVQKEKVKAECVKRFKAEEYKGHKLFIANDLSKRVRNLRKGRMEELKRLREEGKKPFFIYPAKLAFKDQNTGKLVVR